MKLKLRMILGCAILFVNSYGQKKEMQSITENELRAHMEFIASDYMQGRDFGTEIPGLEITADYLKAQCMKMDLKPGSVDFFQIVEMVSAKPDPGNTFFRLIDKNNIGHYKNSDIFTFGGTSGNDTIKGDIVFCGYGWYNEETKYNDTEGLDLKGKIVLVMTRNHELARDTSNREDQTNTEMMKMSKAFMGGAKALILVPDPLNPDKSWFDMVKNYASGGTYTLKGDKGRSFVPGKLIFGTEELADQIVQESGKTLLQIQEEINASGTPKSFEVKNYSAEIILAKESEPVEGKNVIAILEGSDPVLKNECIVMSAHYDHVGMNANGEIFNGADDNASGTAALLEIAEAFTKMKKAPKRSIVFAWVTAEEKGLYGSAYYSQNPEFPLEKTLTNINMDMVGRSAETEPEENAPMEKSTAGPNGIYIISGKQSSELMKVSDKICTELGLVPSDALTKEFLTRSDYYHFYKNGIPVIGVSTGLHQDYHKTTDEMDKIDYHKMKRVADYCFLLAYEVANKKGRIVVDNPVEKN